MLPSALSIGSSAVRVLIDYRPALRQRTGVGEYVHRMVEALVATAPQCGPLSLTAFSSSWKDRLELPLPAGVDAVDLRWSVSVLNLLWHRCAWPPVEQLTGRIFDVVHSPHPLLIPARRAARVVTIHDLDFLEHTERTQGEIRRDYPALVRRHAAAADRIVVPSHYTAERIRTELGIAADKISVCSNGAPPWLPRRNSPRPGHLLFVGTLAPRKNLPALLDAYGNLLEQRSDPPDLVVVGQRLGSDRNAVPVTSALRHKVRFMGYVSEGRLRQLYEGARMLIFPSLNEGFGLPALEAMTVGVPVVASNQGALPEVVGDAGLLVDPTNVEGITAAIERVLDDDELAGAMVVRGFERAKAYDWRSSAVALRDAYRRAVEDWRGTH